MKRSLILILIVILFSLIFTGCYDSWEVDDQTYVIAIGIDKGKHSKTNITIQYALANAIGSGNPQGGGGSTGKNVKSVTIEATSLVGSLNMFNQFIAKRLNLSHAVVMVISEELAKEGVKKYLRGIARYREFRPTIYIAIARHSARDYIKSIAPIQEIDPSKFYQLIFEASKTTGYTDNTQFVKFYQKMESPSLQPVAALVDVGKYNSPEEFSGEKSTYKEKEHMIPLEGDYKAGDIPKAGDEAGELMGLAVFAGDKMVGELDGEESMLYLMVTGQLNEGSITLPDPKVPDNYVAINVRQSRKPQKKVDLSGDNPKIHVKIQLEGDFFTIQSGHNYESLAAMPGFEQAASEFVKKDLEYLLNKTASEYKSDICGFGEEARKQFLTIDEWEAYKWLEKYSDSTFDVEVDLKMRRPGQIIRTSPVRGSEIKGDTE
jgi:spore germination protein KC